MVPSFSEERGAQVPVGASRRACGAEMVELLASEYRKAPWTCASFGLLKWGDFETFEFEGAEADEEL